MHSKKTALTETHIALGAKMAPFGGFEMPIQYTGVKEEHHAVRKSLGVFDVSHMGEFYVKGSRALKLLERVCSNSIAQLAVGKAQYNYLPNRIGGIIDDLIVYRLAENNYFLVVNAANIIKVWEWISVENENIEAELEDVSIQTALLAIQGPRSLETMQSLTDIELHNLPYYGVQQGTFAGISNVIIATTGYTGSGGIEIYFPNTAAQEVWDKVIDAGASAGIKPVGLAARDTLRLEMGYCLYGHEINDNTNPLAAGLGWITKPHPNNLAYDFLQEQKNILQTKKLVGFRMIDRGIPRAEYSLCDEKGQSIGYVSSGTQSPSLNMGIGLGYVEATFAQQGQIVFVEIRKKMVKAEVVKLPFYRG